MKQETIINRLEKIRDDINKINVADKLNELIGELKVDEIATHKVGKFNVNAYFKKFVKQTSDYNSLFKSTHKMKNGKFGIVDGYKFIQFEDENDPIALSLYNAEGDDQMVQYENIVNNSERKLKIDTEYLEKLIKYNKVNKLRGHERVPYVDKFDEEEYIGFNAEWLSDLLKLNNTDTITLGKTKHTPVEIKSEKYSCVLLPVRVDKNNETTQKILAIKQELQNIEEAK